MSCCYLLHIHPPLAHAHHYIGWTKDDAPHRRLERHRNGSGSKMLAAAVAKGSRLTLIYTWPGGTPRFEAWLKRLGNAKQWCPCCGVRARNIPQLANVPAAFDGQTKRARRTRLKAMEATGATLGGS